MTITTPEIEKFFHDPAVEPVLPGEFGILYLLRRDVDACFRTPIALFPATITLMTGVDLLGKFKRGSDKTGEVGKRFTNFCVLYLGVNEDQAKAIYQLRNALTHSFGLYSTDRHGNIFRFNLANDGGRLIDGPSGGQVYKVDIETLRVAFHKGVSAYYADLIDDSPHGARLRRNFSAIYPNYGTMQI